MPHRTADALSLRSAQKLTMAVTESPAFKLEEFSWQWPDRLEVTGQWRGIEPTRLHDPVLLIKVGGDARTLTAHVPRASGERSLAGHRWRATFRYSKDPTRISGAELRAGPGFAVALPPPSATRRRFERLVLDVRVEGEAARAAVRAEADPRNDAATAGNSEAIRLHDEVERSRREVIEQRAVHAEETRKLRQQLREERTRSEQLAREVERHQAARAASEADIVHMGHQLRAMKEARDQLRARARLETERLRHGEEKLQRARSREAADVERLSGTVRTVRAAMERLTLDHRAVLRHLTDELDSALARIEMMAVESGGQAEIVRRAIADHAADAPSPIMRKRLDALAQQTRELAELSRALRRRAARMDASEDDDRAQGGR